MQFPLCTKWPEISPVWIRKAKYFEQTAECAEWFGLDYMLGVELQILLQHDDSIRLALDGNEVQQLYEHADLLQREQVLDKVRAMRRFWCREMNKGLDNMIMVGSNVYPVSLCCIGRILMLAEDVVPFYCDRPHFVVEDIYVCIHTPVPLFYYLTVDEVNYLCYQSRLYRQPTVVVGDVNTVITFSCNYNDEIGHMMFGLPRKDNNPAAGLVIKPGREHRFDDGARVIAISLNRANST